jgi:hypothetical protein
VFPLMDQNKDLVGYLANDKDFITIEIYRWFMDKLFFLFLVICLVYEYVNKWGLYGYWNYNILHGPWIRL